VAGIANRTNLYSSESSEDAQLSVDELRDMVGHNGKNFSNRVLHYASSLGGTRQYWMQQRRRLISMIDTYNFFHP